MTLRLLRSTKPGGCKGSRVQGTIQAATTFLEQFTGGTWVVIASSPKFCSGMYRG